LSSLNNRAKEPIVVAGKDWIIEPDKLDYSNIVADIEAIRQINSQRGDMEHLTAIIYDDGENNVCAGYKDVSHDEFWIAGHMPGAPLMPGVVICEAAAQVCSYHALKHDLLGCDIMGFGGLGDVKFRGAVIPGDRLTVSCMLTKMRRNAIVVSRFQAFVGDTIVCDGEIRGIPLWKDDIRKLANREK
jgi:3-hydroxyacyl-[acyl-carrier-protein] dehydratase